MDGWIKAPLAVNSNLNWSRLFTLGFFAQQLEQGRYVPIQPYTRGHPYRLLLIGAYSPDAPPSWYLGCWVSIQLEVAPGLMSNYQQLAELQRYSIPLGRYRLIWIPDLGQSASALRFTFPYWLQRVEIECWFYDAEITTELEITLARIENEILTLT